jgi:hypothetical protein
MNDEKKAIQKAEILFIASPNDATGRKVWKDAAKTGHWDTGKAMPLLQLSPGLRQHCCFARRRDQQDTYNKHLPRVRVSSPGCSVIGTRTRKPIQIVY